MSCVLSDKRKNLNRLQVKVFIYKENPIDLRLKLVQAMYIGTYVFPLTSIFLSYFVIHT